AAVGRMTGCMTTGQMLASLTKPEELYELLDPDVMWYSASVDSNDTCNSADDVIACIERNLADGLSDWELAAEGADFALMRPVRPDVDPAATMHLLLRLRGGLVVEMRDFRTRDDALAYVGQSAW